MYKFHQGHGGCWFDYICDSSQSHECVIALRCIKIMVTQVMSSHLQQFGYLSKISGFQ